MGNLLSNALCYMPEESHVTVRARSEGRISEPSSLLIRVFNTWSG